MQSGMLTKGQAFYSLLFLLFLLAPAWNIAHGNQDQPIVFLHYWTGALSGGIDDMVAAADPGPEGVRVRATGFDHESFKVGIRIMLDSGKPPDLFSYWAGARVQSLVDVGQLAPIDDVWDREGLDSSFSDSVRTACTYDGNIYALPVTQHYVAFFYNKAIFERHGLTPPQTWEQFLELCSTLKGEGQTPIALGTRDRWPAQFWFDYLLLHTTGHAYRQRLMLGQASFTDPEVKRVFALWASLLQQGFFMDSPNVFDWSEAAKAVHSGEAAMTLMGSWVIGLFEGQLGWDADEDFDFFPMPMIDPSLPQAAVGPIDVIVVAAEGQVAKAKQAIGIFSRVEAQVEMSLGSGALSPHQDAPQGAYTTLQLRLLELVNETQVWSFNYDLATPPQAAEIGLDCFTLFVDDPGNWEPLLQRTQEQMAQAFAGLETEETD